MAKFNGLDTGCAALWLLIVAECNPGSTGATTQLVFDLMGYFIPVS